MRNKSILDKAVEKVVASKDMKDPVLIINTGGTDGITREELISLISGIPSDHFGVNLYDFEPHLTPSNLDPDDWIKIGKIVERNYENHQGFVVIHDIDVMTYTAAGLSFVLEHLGKPVILTGGLPISEENAGISRNLVTSLRIAAPESSTDIPSVPEVCVFFKDTLLRGTRACYVSSYESPKFESPFYPPLGKIKGKKIEIYEDLIRKDSNHQLRVPDRLETNILTFEIFPGVPFEILTHSLEHRQIKGVILRTFGEFSRAQVDEEFLRQIKSAHDRGIPVVNVSGHLSEALRERLHEVNAELSKKGIISGLDMTPEAALCKLMYILGSGKFDAHTRRRLASSMQIDYRGEQSLEIFNIDFGNFGVGEAEFGRTNEEKAVIPGTLRVGKIYKAIFRIQELNVQMARERKHYIVKFFLNLQDASLNTSEDLTSFVGATPAEWHGEPINLTFDVKETVKTAVNPGRPIYIRAVTNQQRVIWDEMKIEIYCDA